MANNSDMTTALTRAEFYEGLDSFKAVVGARFDALEHKTELWNGAMSDRVSRGETRLDGVETRLDRVEIRLDKVETRLERVEVRLEGVETQVAKLSQQVTELPRLMSVEIARHTTAMVEQVQTYISVLDEKYQDLPARVTKLEAKVYAPKRKRR